MTMPSAWSVSKTGWHGTRRPPAAARSREPAILFNSYEFIFVFLPVVVAGFFLIARSSRALAALWLAAASLFFYGWWNPRFVTLLLGSIALNYALGYRIGKVRGTLVSKAFLTAGVAANLIILGVFKYANFFLGSVEALAGGSLPHVDIVLPLGISFFTFTQIAFLVDVHRGLAREYNLIHYLLFVTYFPHLIAGPLLHHKQMMPQFSEPSTYHLRAENIAVGTTIFAIGLAKKVLLADNLAEYATPTFDAVRDGAELKFFAAWFGALAYTLQLYFDFSGYSDMAVGLSRLFGVALPLNFASPYKAHNIIEFWRRWHMSLSQFLRDYLYVPLGGNRRGKARRYLNLMITMVLGGLWHGASWTFVAWGALHGSYLVINHAWQRLRQHAGFADQPSSAGRVAGAAITFTAVVIAWVLFRSDNFDAALRMLAGMFGLNGVSLPERFAALPGSGVLGTIGVTFGGALRETPWRPDTGALQGLFFVVGGLCIVWGLPNTQQWIAGLRERLPIPVWRPVLPGWQPSALHGAMIGALFGASILYLTKFSEFLYFRF